MALKDLLRRAPATHDGHDATAADACDAGSDVTTRIAELAPREQATIAGHIASMRIVPAKDGSAWLEATVQDGTGTVIVVWTGRKRIPGIRPGARLVATGRPVPAATSGTPILYNPSYELLA